ncbi:MAG: histidine kinase dimerization/phosphoacceptor domain -containing protein [Methanobacterium sp.]
MIESFLDNIKGWKYVLNSFPDLITILDTRFKVIWVNNAMAEALNTDPKSCVGLTCYEVVHGAESPILNCPHEKMIRDGTEHIEEVEEDNLGGYFLVSASPIKDDSGTLLGSVHIARNITERKIMEDKIKKSLEEREMLIKETHHRVKNNLMVISSLLSLQARYIKDQETQEIFKDSQNRARSMAIIHEKLYQTTDLKKIDFGEYIQKLSLELFRTYSDKSKDIDLDLDVEDHQLDVNTSIPLGLIVNELISNSIKHAFLNGGSGQIRVKFLKEGSKYIFEVSDNGIGLPDEFNLEEVDTLGLSLVVSLVDQIRGELEYDGHDGTRFTIIFKEEFE